MPTLTQRIESVMLSQSAMRRGELPPEAIEVLAASAAKAQEIKKTGYEGEDVDRGDFEHLLAAVGQKFGFEDGDFGLMRSLLNDASPSGRAEVARTVRQWRLDLLTYGLADQVAGDVAHRARTAFEQVPAPAAEASAPRRMGP